MTRLIVEENGQRRAFKVNDGVLTVGGSSSAALTLSSEGVAEVHAELVITDGRAVLRPKPGVVAPTLGGVPVEHEIEVPHATEIVIGEARISFEYEGEEAAPAAQSQVVAPVVRKKSAAGGRSRARKKVPQGRAVTATRRKSVVQTSRARSRGMPSWLVVVLFLGGAGLAVFVGSRLLLSTPVPERDPNTALAMVERYMSESKLDDAVEILDAMPVEEFDLATRQRVEAVRKEVDAAVAEAALSVHNLSGNPYLQGQLKNFEEQRLRGKAGRPEARVFLKRCDEFERRWPQHPGLDWVARMRARFTPIAELDQPTNLADVAFEVKALTWANPRDFGQAFALLQRFVDEEIDPDELDQGMALLDGLTQERKDWFADRMQQARFEYDRGEVGKSVAWLVMLINYVGDEEMADQAAEELVKFDGLEGWLEAYKRDKPERFAELQRNAVMGSYIRSKKLGG